MIQSFYVKPDLQRRKNVEAEKISGNLIGRSNCRRGKMSSRKSHNKNITTETAENATKSCNCKDKEKCPLKGNCQETSIIYNAKVTPKNDTNKSNIYIGLTEHAFKKRFFLRHWVNHKPRRSLFKRNEAMQLMSNGKTLYHKSEKIVTTYRSELIFKCRHENKYYLTRPT